MADTKFGKYFKSKPWGIPRQPADPEAPTYIGLGQEAPVEGWDESISMVLRPIYKP